MWDVRPALLEVLAGLSSLVQSQFRLHPLLNHVTYVYMPIYYLKEKEDQRSSKVSISTPRQRTKISQSSIDY